MNIFVNDLARTEISPKPAVASRKFVVDDNIGESIHIHYRNFRLELSIDDYLLFADQMEQAKEELIDGNR